MHSNPCSENWKEEAAWETDVGRKEVL